MSYLISFDVKESLSLSFVSHFQRGQAAYPIEVPSIWVCQMCPHDLIHQIHLSWAGTPQR